MFSFSDTEDSNFSPCCSHARSSCAACMMVDLDSSNCFSSTMMYSCDSLCLLSDSDRTSPSSASNFSALPRLSANEDSTSSA